MDGTLIETDYANFLSYKKAIESVSGPDDSIRYDPNLRLNRVTLIQKIPNLTEVQYDEIINKKEFYYRDFLSETRLKLEVANYLNRYYTQNRTVLVTRSRVNRAFLTLNHFKLINKFSNIFSQSTKPGQTRANKYDSVITHLQIYPELAIVFENDRGELADAVKAGIPPQNLIEIV